eukprot:COSAG01_NODE_19257_length_1021_cov_1.343818_3_plen_121_part_01
MLPEMRRSALATGSTTATWPALASMPGARGGVGFEMGFGAGGAGEWAERVEQERLAAQEREEAHRRQLQRWEVAAEEVRLQIIGRRAAHRQQQQQARSAVVAGATAAPPRSAPVAGGGAGW